MLAVCGQHQARYDETGLCPLQLASQAQFPTESYAVNNYKKDLANLI